MRVEVHGDEQVILAFDRFAAELPEGSKKVVKDALNNIKTEWARDWKGKFAHAPRIHRSITYEITDSGPLVIRGEVGPLDEPVNQGWLGRILTYGAEHSGPHPAGDVAADRESLRYAAAVDAPLNRIEP